MKIWNSVLHPPRFSLGKRITLIPPHLTDTTTAHFTCAFTPLSPLSTKRNWKLWFFPLRYGIRSGNGNILLCHKLGIRSLLSWRFLSCGQSLLSSLMYWHFYLEANVQKKLGFALNWRLWKDSFWGKIKEGKKDWYVHSVYKSIKNVSFSLLIENEPFLVNFIHCACFFTLRKRRKNWMNVSLPYSHPKSLLFLMIRLWWKEALMRRFCLLSFSGAPLSYEKSSDVLTKSHWQLHAGMMSSVINALDLNHILLNQRPIKNMGIKLFLTNAFQSLYSS